MGTYGAGKYSGGVYGGGQPPIVLPNIPVIVELFDNTLAYKGAFQTGAGDFAGVEFTTDQSGSRDFTLFFGASQNIDKTDIIKIKLFGNENYFFTGVVRTTPIPGSTKSEYNYSGFGLNDYLLRINAESQTFLSKTISEILNSLLDNIIIPKTPIQKNVAKLQPPVLTVSSLTVNYSQMPEVLDALKKLASGTGTEYITGVDETGEFFFLPKSTDIQTTLIVGAKGDNGIPGYEPEDEYEALTKLFVLDDDGILVTTLSSTEDNDLYEEKVLAPKLDNSDIVTWARGILLERETNSRRASVQWKIEESEPTLLLGRGIVRIISNVPPPDTTPPDPNPYGSGVYGSGLYGGGQIEWEQVDDDLEVKEITYTLRDNQSIRTIQLGAVPVRLDEQIKNIRKSQLNLEINLGK